MAKYKQEDRPPKNNDNGFLDENMFMKADEQAGEADFFGIRADGVNVSSRAKPNLGDGDGNQGQDKGELQKRKEGFDDKFRDFYKDNRGRGRREKEEKDLSKADSAAKGDARKAKLYQGRGRGKVDRSARQGSRYRNFFVYFMLY